MAFQPIYFHLIVYIIYVLIFNAKAFPGTLLQIGFWEIFVKIAFFKSYNKSVCKRFSLMLLWCGTDHYL